MKKVSLIQIGLTLSTVLVCSLLSGCVRTEQTSTEEVTTSGKNWVETHTRQATKGKDGKVRIEEQSFYEKVKCIGKNGKKIDVDSPEECIKKGGRVIDKIVTTETSEKHSH
ncbi:MAG TPA: hypothetical protein VGU44_04185 [Gammaproteobacteria bacterium]|nr:hypothetical protein [Gammaproteobacteria bacterium]